MCCFRSIQAAAVSIHGIEVGMKVFKLGNKVLKKVVPEMLISLALNCCLNGFCAFQ